MAGNVKQQHKSLVTHGEGLELQVDSMSRTGVKRGLLEDLLHFVGKYQITHIY